MMFTEIPKALLQPFHNRLRHPEMKRRRDESWCIRRSRQVVRQPAVHKIGHALRRSRLFHVALLPAHFFQLLLKSHYAKRLSSIAANIFRAKLHHHTAVAPLRTTIGGRHTVDNNLLVPRCCGYDKSTRTHAERIDSPTIDLSDHGIFSSGQIATTSARVVVLNPVNQFCRML